MASTIVDEHPSNEYQVSSTRHLPPMLTAKEASTLLRVRLPQVYTLAREGVLPSVRVARTVRFNRDRLFAWIEAGGAGLPEVGK